MRITIFFAALISTAWSFSAFAAADGIPLYDVDKACQDRLKNPQAVNACVATEQEAYDTVDAMWPSMSDNGKASCSATAVRQPMWKYVYLRSCLQADYDRHQFDTTRHFKP